MSLDLGANSTIDRALSALRVHCIRFSKLFNFQPWPCADRIQGGRTRRVPPLKLEKNIIFWRKIVIFHTKYPKNVRASLRSPP